MSPMATDSRPALKKDGLLVKRNELSRVWSGAIIGTPLLLWLISIRSRGRAVLDGENHCHQAGSEATSRDGSGELIWDRERGTWCR